MKHKNQLPKRFQKYVRWAVYNPEGHQLHNWKYRSNALKNARRDGEDFTVLPVLCVPLSVVFEVPGLNDKRQRVIRPRELRITLPKEDA